MAGPSSVQRHPPPDSPTENRLESWKAIALYLKRDVSTVQRWEKRAGLPIHRLHHPKVTTVFAFKPELDEWWRDGHAARERAERVEAAVLRLRYWWLRLAGVAAIIVALMATGLVLRRPSQRVARFTRVTKDGRPKDWLVASGRRLYYQVPTNNHWGLAELSMQGGAPRLLATPAANMRILDVSSDRNELLAGSFADAEREMPLWTISLPSGHSRRVGDVVARAAAWSPDGRRIVYAHGHEFFLAKSDGTGSRLLFKVKGLPYWLRWSPDGNLLRFSLEDVSNMSSSLWEVRADGTGLHPLLAGWNDPPEECCGNWTPGGRRFVFQTTRGGMTNIWAINENHGLLAGGRSEPVQVTAGPMNFMRPVPGADGRKLFVVGEQRRGEVIRYDRQSGQFVEFMPGLSAYSLEFSPDGQWMSYVTYPEGNLWRSRTDGTARLQLSFPPLRAFGSAWSPDGKQIAFMGKLPRKSWQDFVVAAEGGMPQQVTPGGPDFTDPVWSPDGKSLAVSGEPVSHTQGPSVTAIYLMDLKTRRLSMIPGSKGLFSPQWSPDGRYLSTLTADESGLVLLDAKSGKRNRLVRMRVAYPGWSHDGKYIYFAIAQGGNYTFYRLRVTDRRIERIASHYLFTLVSWEDFGSWVGYGPDDSLLLLRDIGAQDIYALDWVGP